MINRSLFALPAAASLLALCASANSPDLAADVNAALGLSQSDVQELRIDVTSAGAVLADLAIDGVWYQLELQPHSLRSVNYQVLEQLDDGSLVAVEPTPDRTLRGTLIGAPGSVVGASLLDDGLHARIRLADGQDWWVQPVAQHVQRASAAQHAVYHSDWVLEHHGLCGADSLANNVQAQDPARPGSGQTYGNLELCELACDADFEYFQTYGSVAGTTNQINTVINAMNVQYETEVGITHEVGTIIVRSTSNDPYTSSDPSTLLNQFRSHWNNNQTGVQRDVAQLFTGRNINGGVIGIAWLGVICSGSFGYGLVQSNFSSNFSCKTDLSAHELGHNWNADHCSCSSNTMNPSITCANTFHPSSTRPEIISHRNSRNCLSDGGSAPDLLFSDGFESGNYTAGGWVLQNNRPRIKAAAHRTGSFGARIRRASWIERSISTVGYQDIRLGYSRRTRNLDSGESFTIEYYNGSTWIQVETMGNTGNNWSDVDFDLGGDASNNASFKIRFRVSASEGRERGDLDDVTVYGTP